MLSKSLRVPDSLSARAASGRRNLLAATAFGVALVSAAPVFAADDYSADVVSLNSPTIYVDSSVDEYTAAEFGPTIQGTINVKLSTGAAGRIYFWSAWPEFGYKVGDHGPFDYNWVTYPGAGMSKSYSSPRPKKENATFNFSAGTGDYDYAVVAACNSHADKLRSEGMSNTEIFSKDRWVQIAVKAGLEYEMSGPEGNPEHHTVSGLDTHKKINVICKGDPVHLDAPQQAITGAFLSVEVAQANVGNRSCALELDGYVVSKDPQQEVAFRYFDTKGNQSDLKTVTTNANGVASFKHSYPLKDGENHNGKVRMVGHNLPFLSNWGDFDADCAEQVDDFKVELPPKAKSMGFVVDQEIMRDGLACPSVITVEGNIESYGTAKGTIKFGAGGGFIHQEFYSFSGEDTREYRTQHTLSWPNPSATKQSVNFGIYLHSSQGVQIGKLEGVKHFECYEPQPPDPVVLDLKVTEEVARGLLLCPAAVEVRSLLKGGGGVFSGTAYFTANAAQSAPQPVTVSGEAFSVVTETFPVSWQDEEETEQGLELSVFVRGANDEVVGARSGSEVLTCRDASPELGAVWMVPSSDVVMHGTMACPAMVELTSDIASRGVAFSGIALARANASQIGAVPVSIQAEGPESIQTLRVPYPVSWTGVDGFSQSVQLAVSLRDSEGAELASAWKTHEVKCYEVDAAGAPQGGNGTKVALPGFGAPDTTSTGRLVLGQKPGTQGAPNTASQRPSSAIGKTTLRPGAGFAIQSPKGRVRQGQVQLSGGQPNAKYTLRFYRKTGKGYQRVRSASLPKQMTGTKATFNPKALSGSRTWRIEVCPAGSKDKKACQSSDFQLPRLKGAGGVKAPANPDTTKVFIMPGVGN